MTALLDKIDNQPTPAPVDTREPRTASEALRWVWWRICEQHNARKLKHDGDALGTSTGVTLNSWAWNAMLDLGVMAEADRLSALEKAPVLSELTDKERIEAEQYVIDWDALEAAGFVIGRRG